MKIFDLFKNNKNNNHPKNKYIRQYRIAGVTFKNDDGKKRQDIIKQMHDGDPLIIEKYTYNNALAIKILNKKGEQIGNIKEQDISNILDIYDDIFKTEIFNISSFYDGYGKKIYNAELIVHYIA